MIDKISLTHEQIKRYEDPDYELPENDRITPIIKNSIRRQNVDFFLDERSHSERNSIQVRVLYNKELAFEWKDVKIT